MCYIPVWQAYPFHRGVACETNVPWGSARAMRTLLLMASLASFPDSSVWAEPGNEAMASPDWWTWCSASNVDVKRSIDTHCCSSVPFQVVWTYVIPVVCTSDSPFESNRVSCWFYQLLWQWHVMCNSVQRCTQISIKPFPLYHATT